MRCKRALHKSPVDCIHQHCCTQSAWARLRQWVCELLPCLDAPTPGYSCSDFGSGPQSSSRWSHAPDLAESQGSLYKLLKVTEGIGHTRPLTCNSCITLAFSSKQSLEAKSTRILCLLCLLLLPASWPDCFALHYKCGWWGATWSVFHNAGAR